MSSTNQALTKEQIEAARGIDPMAFLKGTDIKDTDKKEENVDVKPQPAKELKSQLEKVKKEKEELAKKIKELEERTGEISELEPLRPVADYLKKKTGKLDPETVTNELIEKNRKRKKELAEKEEALKNKDQKIKEISIDQSDEWQNEYVKPIVQAREILETSIYNVDNQGKVRHPELMKELFNRIVSVDNEGNTKTSLEIKAEIRKFATEYEKATGLDYEAPLLKEVVDSVNAFHSRIKTAQQARQEWSQTIESKKRERDFESAKKREKEIEKELKGRDYIFSEYKESIDAKSLSDVFEDPNEFIKAAEDEHLYLKEALSGKSDLKRREYNEFIDIAAKGKMFDKLVSRIKELTSKVKELEGDEKSPRFNGGVSPSTKREGGQIKLKPGEKYDPTAFLK